MKLPEWANWLARDEDGSLFASKGKPYKVGDHWEVSNPLNDGIYETETDDRYKNIKWEDEFPTFVDKDRNTFKWLEKPDLQLTKETLNGVFKPKSDDVSPLPEWAKWLARDENYELWCFTTKPSKAGDAWDVEDGMGYCERLDDVDDIYNDIQWTDEEPTNVKSLVKDFSDKAESLRELGEALTRNWEAEHGKPSIAEYNQWQITQAKAHGYDEVPELVGTDEVETTSLSFEDTMALLENDMINQPLHYVGEQGLEVEVVLQNFIPRYEDTYVGHRIASAIEYLLRSPLKNQRQDIEKAGKNIQQALAYLDMTEEEE